MSLDMTLFALAVVLIAIEFMVPGFGIFGIGGLLALMAGFFFFFGGGIYGATVVAGILFVLVLTGALLFWYLPSSSRWNPFVLWDKQNNSVGYTGSDDFAKLLGARGKVLATLRPAGTAIIEGDRYDVVSVGDFIEKDVEIEVVKVEGSKIFVKQV